MKTIQSVLKLLSILLSTGFIRGQSTWGQRPNLQQQRYENLPRTQLMFPPALGFDAFNYAFPSGFNSIVNPGRGSTNNAIGNTAYNTVGNRNSLIQNNPLFSHTYFPDMYPSTQVGKEAAIEQSRIFWAMTPDFIRASNPFPKTPEGLRAQNEFYRDFWRNAPRVVFAAKLFPGTSEGLNFLRLRTTSDGA